jgi:NADP-dependent 3-hydroxy acid dehydrogenase YdfG
MPSRPSDVWLITGCSTGFGRELAKILPERGYKVVATARDTAKIQDLATGHGNSVLPLKLDVTNPAEVIDGVRAAEAAFGRIDVLVNNAGYGYLGSIEESDENEIRAMFEANFFGLSNMVRAVLPGMRQRRHGSIVNLSSIGGLVGMPGVGYYNATKFAVEGLSEALAKEVNPIGIQVLVVEPGPFRTDWAGRSLKTAHNTISEYAETAGANVSRISGRSGTQAGDPVRAAEAMIKAVESANAPLHLALGQMAIDTARNKLDSLRRDLDSWESTSIDADFPESRKRSAS